MGRPTRRAVWREPDRWPLGSAVVAAVVLLGTAAAFWPGPGGDPAGKTAAVAARATVGGPREAPLHPPGRVEIRETWATKGAPGQEFTWIGGMAENSDGSVWVTDSWNRVVVAFDRAGRSPRLIARKGKGPGEMEGPTLLAHRPRGGVAVYNVANGSVELFAENGRFERRVAIPTLVYSPKGFVVQPSGHFVLSGGTARGTTSIHRFTADGEPAESWYPAQRSSDPRVQPHIAGGPLAVLADGSLLFSQAAPHRIFRFGPSGDVGRMFAEDRGLLKPVAEDFTRVKDGWVTMRWWFPQSRGVFPLSDGRVLNVVRNKEEGYSFWEVYSPRGRRIASARVERDYEPWAMARDGTLLASYTDPDTDEVVAARLAITVR
jgi:hypothetical protein